MLTMTSHLVPRGNPQINVRPRHDKTWMHQGPTTYPNVPRESRPITLEYFTAHRVHPNDTRLGVRLPLYDLNNHPMTTRRHLSRPHDRGCAPLRGTTKLGLTLDRCHPASPD